VRGKGREVVEKREYSYWSSLKKEKTVDWEREIQWKNSKSCNRWAGVRENRLWRKKMEEATVRWIAWRFFSCIRNKGSLKKKKRRSTDGKMGILSIKELLERWKGFSFWSEERRRRTGKEVGQNLWIGKRGTRGGDNLLKPNGLLLLTKELGNVKRRGQFQNRHCICRKDC